MTNTFNKELLPQHCQLCVLGKVHISEPKSKNGFSIYLSTCQNCYHQVEHIVKSKK